MSPTNSLHTGFGQPEVLHLANPDQVLHGACDILNRHVRVDTMLIEQVNRVDIEPLERRFGDFLDVLRPTVQT